MCDFLIFTPNKEVVPKDFWYTRRGQNTTLHLSQVLDEVIMKKYD